ncbi:NADH-dependent oxidoreductase [Limosilactobacillus reuteri]|uniref:oxidoreductase n=1 Tax=Limosilactobacillus reuteri TaxID=1598 RepID=UPI0025500884|nr:NADH-dependent oxidoreductase [Limosilactobacillus reuteri]MDK8117281.1 NADH-dependent oxidoreductase [Limosilactobacillus reuteri]
MMTKYKKLFEPVTFSNGVKAQNRFMLAPMCDDSAENGQVTDQQLEYMKSRAANVGIAVTGYAYVNDSGDQVPGQLSVAHDEDINGLAKLATVMKAGGAKAILQLSHAGRGAGGSVAKGYQVYAPSKLPFPWLDYDVDEMTTTDIEQVISDYAQATKRAIAAGFDGIEIHNCNHDLLQQFFSASANHRTDEWGGSREKRMALPLAIQCAVKKVIAESGNANFILGWRISPQEKHGDEIGYDVDDMFAQTKKVAELGIDYLNISLNLSADYSNSVRPSYDVKVKGTNKSFPEYYRAALRGYCPIYIGSNVLTADDALAAVTDAEGVYVGRELLMDPDFVQKIAENRLEEIVNTTTIEKLKTVGLPDGFVDNYADKDGSTRVVSYRNGIPLPGLD